MFGRRKDPLAALERNLDYRFRDRSLLETALTHPSYRFENSAVVGDNQRLEFLGDAVLGLLTAEHVYRTQAAGDEGLLTVLRSQATSGRALCAIAEAVALGVHLRIGRGEEQTGGRTRPSNLTDALEAVVGAAWLDGGNRAVSRIFQALFVPAMGGATDNVWAGNPKGHLQARAQARFKTAPLYRLLATTGPQHAPTYRVEVRIGRTWVAEGAGRTKRAAEFDAAQHLLRRLESSPSTAADADAASDPA